MQGEGGAGLYFTKLKNETHTPKKRPQNSILTTLHMSQNPVTCTYDNPHVCDNLMVGRFGNRVQSRRVAKSAVRAEPVVNTSPFTYVLICVQ